MLTSKITLIASVDHRLAAGDDFVGLKPNSITLASSELAPN